MAVCGHLKYSSILWLAGLVFKPPFRPDLLSGCQIGFSRIQRLCEFLIRHVRVSEFIERLAWELSAEPTVIEMPLIPATIVQGAYASRHLGRPERFALDIATSLALLSEELALAAFAV